MAGCGGCDDYCSTSCGGCGDCDGSCYGCAYGCDEGCGGGCGGCDGGCKGGCKTSCTGTCSGGCTSCDGCANSCRGTCGRTCLGACNAGCAKGVAEQAFAALTNGLQQYITEQDINNIYLIFQAIKSRRTDAGISTSELDSLTFTQYEKTINSTDISKLANTASKVGYSITDNSITQYNLIDDTTFTKLLEKAKTGYNTSYPRGSIT